MVLTPKVLGGPFWAFGVLDLSPQCQFYFKLLVYVENVINFLEKEFCGNWTCY